MCQSPVFITGIGTDIGKTVVSAIVCKALGADYWKPVQAGFSDGTDAGRVNALIAEDGLTVHPETYKLALAASPHIAARREGVTIEIDQIIAQYKALDAGRRMVIEGAGGLMVPLNQRDFMLDLVKKLDAVTILVSRNYLGSINHSMLTAMVCRERGIRVAGWIFNDQYLDYEQEIADWSGYPVIGRIPFDEVNPEFIRREAAQLKPSLNRLLC